MGKEFSDNVSYGKDNDTEPTRTTTNTGIESASAWRPKHNSGCGAVEMHAKAGVSAQSELSRERSGSCDPWQSRKKESATDRGSHAKASQSASARTIRRV